MHGVLHHTLRWLAAAFLASGCVTPNPPAARLDPAYAGQGCKPTRRERFLTEMNKVVPWAVDARATAFRTAATGCH